MTDPLPFFGLLRRTTVPIVKTGPLAAVAFVLRAMSSQAQAAPRHPVSHHCHVTYEQQVPATTFESVYRDPTTREALDEGTW